MTTLVSPSRPDPTSCSTGVSLKYMLDFGANPIERQLILSAQFLHNELPVRLAHRVAELENLPFGLSAKPPVLKVTVLLCVVYTALLDTLHGFRHSFVS